MTQREERRYRPWGWLDHKAGGSIQEETEGQATEHVKRCADALSGSFCKPKHWSCNAGV